MPLDSGDWPYGRNYMCVRLRPRLSFISILRRHYIHTARNELKDPDGLPLTGQYFLNAPLLEHHLAAEGADKPSSQYTLWFPRRCLRFGATIACARETSFSVGVKAIEVLVRVSTGYGNTHSQPPPPPGPVLPTAAFKCLIATWTVGLFLADV